MSDTMSDPVSLYKLVEGAKVEIARISVGTINGTMQGFDIAIDPATADGFCDPADLDTPLDLDDVGTCRVGTKPTSTTTGVTATAGPMYPDGWGVRPSTAPPPETLIGGNNWWVIAVSIEGCTITVASCNGEPVVGSTFTYLGQTYSVTGVTQEGFTPPAAPPNVYTLSLSPCPANSTAIRNEMYIGYTPPPAAPPFP